MADFREGKVPGSDGSGYNPLSPTPSLDQVLNRMLEEEMFGEVQVIAVGKLGSPGREISGLSVLTDYDSIAAVARQGGNVQAQWSTLFGAVTPFEHVQSIDVIEW